jgi:hypothetical protein
MTIRYFYADSYICIKAFAIHLISNEVAFWVEMVCFEQEKGIIAGILEMLLNEEGKHLVGGTE